MTACCRTGVLFPMTLILVCLVSPRAAGQTESGQALAALRTWCAQDRTARPPLAHQPFATVPLSRADAAAAQELLATDHAAWVKSERAEEMRQRRLKEDRLEMPFFYRIFGAKPAGGRSLYISLHGGGNAPKATNDQQYENQKRLYTLEEGVYLAPRAPTDTWNLWHEAHIDRFLARLIENLIVFEEVNPNRVYLLGYSAGGDGVYQLAPRMADRWAAAAMMAGHPNETTPEGLRNVPFTIHVGANDSAYNRNRVAGEWGRKLDDLQRADPAGYVHWVKLHEGKPHWMDGEDAQALPWMAKYTRNPWPSRVVWKQDDITHTRFYWLAVAPEQAKKDAMVVATRAGQTLTLERCDVDRLTMRLNDAMADLDQPVTITREGKTLFAGPVRRTIAVLDRTLREYGDPAAVFSAEVTIEMGR
jgi:hypothetical protein